MIGIPSRRAVARTAAVVLAAGVCSVSGLAVAGGAYASDVQANAQGSAQAQLGDLIAYEQVTVPKEGTVNAGTVALNENGASMQVYCIDLYHPTHSGVKYNETSWDQSVLSANPNRGKIQWILEHSYPSYTTSQLANEAGVPSLSDKQAAAATQVAIWHFSDSVDATGLDTTAQTVAQWLEDHAVDVQEPTPSLALSAASLAGHSGSQIGPVKVSTNAQSVQVSLSGANGVQLVDGQGQPVSSATDGENLFVKVPSGSAEGSATIQAEASAPVPIGRAFEAVDGDSQTMILAGTASIPVKATATATWADKGPVPSANATEDCKKGGVEVTLGNGGDQPWTTEVGGQSVTVQPGQTSEVFVPEKEGAAYTITVTGPSGFTKTFTGTLSCKPTGAGGASPSPSSTGTTASPSPSGSSAAAAPSPSQTGPALAETGSSSNTPLIGGLGGALVVLGGAAGFVMRKRSKARHAA